jgi:hypothetical protein
MQIRKKLSGQTRQTSRVQRAKVSYNNAIDEIRCMHIKTLKTANEVYRPV